MVMLLLLAFVCLAGAVLYAAEAVWVSDRQRRLSLRRIEAYAGDELGSEAGRLGSTLAAQAPMLARLAGRLDPRATPERVGLKLVAAGVARTVTPTSFLAAKTVLAALGLGLGGVLAVASGSVGRALLVGIALCLAGFLLPDSYLAARARTRRNELRVGLPDALDVLAVSVEAGLGFEAALARVSEHMNGPLVDEFELTLNELRVGESRTNALRRLGERAGFPEMEGFVLSVIQAEQHGAPLGRVLRVQASEARKRRQLAAEEQAMRAPVKMLFPTGLFIFPAMFVVILGPALFRIFETF
ncbi:MAG: type II secretion system F family protein [Gaiella sp.]